MKKTNDTASQNVYIIEGNAIFTVIALLKKEINADRRLASTTVLYFNPIAPNSLYEQDLRALAAKNAAIETQTFDVQLTHDAILPFIRENAYYYCLGGANFTTALKDILAIHKIASNRIHISAIPTIADDEKRPNPIDPHLFINEILNRTTNAIIFTDARGIIASANAAAEQLTGYSSDEMRGHTARLWGGMMPRDFYKTLWHTIAVEKKSFSGKIHNRRKNGTQYTVHAQIYPLTDDTDTVTGFFCIEEDITELENIDRSKMEFISIASHQLRTPIAIIKWYAELFLDGDMGILTPEQQTNIEKINNSNERMIALINSLLDIARMELGTFFAELQNTDIVALAEKIIGGHLSMAREKHINVFPVLDKTIPVLVSDPKLLDIIFRNLISNAIKYTPDGGNIIVSVARRSSSIVIEVSDNGIGIPVNQQSKIFMKLFRADNVKIADTQGSGLGLYAVKAVVERLGGTITFVSEENKGTTFTVTIPKNIA